MYINLTDKQTIAFFEIKQRTNLTNGQLCRRALALLDMSIREINDGNSIAIFKDGKIIKEIVGIV